MNLEEVRISLTQEETHMLTLAIELFQSELKGIYADEEYEDKKVIVDALCNDLNELERKFK